MSELAIGAAAVLAVSILLLLAVTTELAPAGGLTGRGRWWLAAGLGLGVMAFAFKLGLIASIELAPPAAQRLGEAWRGPVEAVWMPAPDAGPAAGYRWEPLPRDPAVRAGDAAASAKAELGERLFFDRNLSADRSVACASCHEPLRSAGADGRRVALGIRGQEGERNAPTVWNAAFNARLFWDGRALSLEDQALGPLVNPREMGMPSHEAVVERLREQHGYAAAFRRAFGKERFGIEEVAAALAAYERTLVTPDTPYDRFVRGDAGALSARQLRGMNLFAAVGCVQCHSGPAFNGWGAPDASVMRAFPVFASDEVARRGLLKDVGRADAGAARGVWRIPGLRNVGLTAPYFHNGSVDTLEDAVRIMAVAQLGLRLEREAGAAPNVVRGVDGRPQLRPAAVITEGEVEDIAEFLRALSDQRLVRASGKTLAERPPPPQVRLGGNPDRRGYPDAL